MTDTAARLGAALLAYMLCITLIITLMPFKFAWPGQIRVLFAGDLPDIVANVVLFVPLGFFYCFSRTRGAVSTLGTLIAGAILSTGIEFTQLFEIARSPTVSDVVANASGAAIGAYVALRVARSPRLEGRLVGWLALELPLMGVVYLLVPLLWVNSLAAGTDFVRAGMALVLGIFGALLVGGIQRHYLGHVRAASPGTTAALAALWFTAGAGPFLARHPQEVVVGAGLVAAIAWVYGRSAAAPPGPHVRRFETALLTRAAPVFAVYLLAVICAPLRHGVTDWHATLALPPVVEQIEILRVLELVAAFTLLGYIAAEWKGRAYAAYGEAVAWVLGWGATLALLTELIRGFDAHSGASFAHALLLVAAGLYGGWLYYLQRAHVMRVLSAE